MPNPIIKQIKLPTGTTYDLQDSRLDDWLGSTDALVFKGVLYTSTASAGSVSKTTFEGTNKYDAGWVYKVGEAGTYAGVTCEVGDMIIACSDQTTRFTAADWQVINTNVDVALFKGSNTFADGQILKADGTSGKVKAVANLSGTVTFAGKNTGEATQTGTIGTTEITPAGTISQATFTGTTASISFSSVSVSNTSAAAHSYAPEGTITNSYTTTGVSFYSISSLGTVPTLTTANVSAVTAVGFKATTGTITAGSTNPLYFASVSNGVLEFGALDDDSTKSSASYVSSWNAGSAPQRESKSALATVEVDSTFAGTTATLSHGTTTGTWSSSVSYTPAGTISTQTFTGTPESHSHTFTGTAHSHSISTYTGTFTVS